MFLVHDNLDFKAINKLNASLNIDLIQQIPQRVQTNVTIAAAITSYARIHMMKIKTLPDVEIFYTDTNRELSKLIYSIVIITTNIKLLI